MNIQDFFHSNIPIIETNDFTIQLDEARNVSVTGLIDKHYNHKQTVYGGSITNALIIAAFGYLHTFLEDSGFNGASVFLKKNTTEFNKPLVKDFVARSVALDKESRELLLRSLSADGKASVSVSAYAAHRDETFRYALFDGIFSIKLI